jgi:hypothetical protein
MNCPWADEMQAVRAVPHVAGLGYPRDMPLLLGCFAVIFPRVVLFLVWLFGNGWLERAITNALVLLLGFLLMPLTTLAYAYAYHSWSVDGTFTITGWLIVAIAVLVDLGSLRGGHKSYYRRRALE